ncbi:MAG: DUF1853 family protein [Sneathiella sp.]
MATNPSQNVYGAHIASDLEWVIFSPNLLIDTICPDLASLRQSRVIVEEVKRAPEQLLNFISTMKRKNLGTYFEHLVFYWLECLDDVQVINRNLQIYSGKETIGEIDLLFTYKKQIYHWELSVKFYANVGSGLDEDKWVGPLKKDNLKRKLDRLFDHQLPLLLRPQSQEAISPITSKEIISSPYVKGMLFAKADGKIPQLLPQRVSSNCLLSKWCFLSDLETHLPQNASHYCLLSKSQWLGTLDKKNWTPISTLEDLMSELTAHLAASPSPVLVAFGEGSALQLQGISRIFVMQNDWLNTP